MALSKISLEDFAKAFAPAATFDAILLALSLNVNVFVEAGL